MKDHLPECPAGYVADLCTTDIDPVLQEPSCNHCVGQGCICICNRLRACEQRVAAMRKDSGELWLDGYGTGFQDGHSYALDAAREAVDIMVIETAGNSAATVNQALVAIDALREKP